LLVSNPRNFEAALPSRLNLDAINVWMLPQVSERGFGQATDGISLIVWIFRVQAEVRLDS
jgi:hypothetical protein